MRLTICAVGRLRAGPERDLVDRYTQRLSWPVEVREVDVRGRLPAEETKARESALLEAACPDGAIRIALDERGHGLTSIELAGKLRDWRDDGSDVAFFIGGADGLGDDIRRRAALRLSFGAATWPHMLVRVMLTEQIYRAQQIISGHPYHRA